MKATTTDIDTVQSSKYTTYCKLGLGKECTATTNAESTKEKRYKLTLPFANRLTGMEECPPTEGLLSQHLESEGPAA